MTFVSSVEVNTNDLFSFHDGACIPARNGPFDVRMGVYRGGSPGSRGKNTAEEMTCGTCGLGVCEGHFGHIFLAMPVLLVAGSANASVCMLLVPPPSMGRWVLGRRMDRMTRSIGDIVALNNRMIFEKNLGLKQNWTVAAKMREEIVAYARRLKKRGIDIRADVVFEPRDATIQKTNHTEVPSDQNKMRRILMACHGEAHELRRDSVLLSDATGLHATVEEIKGAKTLDVSKTSRPTFLADLSSKLLELGSFDQFDIVTLEYPPSSLYISKEGVLHVPVFTNVSTLLAAGGTFAMMCHFKGTYARQIAKNIERASGLTFLKKTRDDLRRTLLTFEKTEIPSN